MDGTGYVLTFCRHTAILRVSSAFFRNSATFAAPFGRVTTRLLALHAL
jgi:hypothetical protein